MRMFLLFALLFSVPVFSMPDCGARIYRMSAMPPVSKKGKSVPPIVIQTDLEFSAGSFPSMRWHYPDPEYLEEYLPASNPRILFESLELEGEALSQVQARLGQDAAPLLEIIRDFRNKKQVSNIRRRLEALSDKTFFKLTDGDVADYPDVRDKNQALGYEIEHYALKLPWDQVRIELLVDGKAVGYFVAFAWIPATNELVYSGPDFVPAIENGIVEQGPSGCTIPTDLRATQANCGASSIAALLGVSSRKAISDFIPVYQKNQFLMWNHLFKGLERAGQKPVREWVTQKRRGIVWIKEAMGSNRRGLVLIMWSSLGRSMGIGHWVAYVDGQIYDWNMRQSDGTWGGWLPEEVWHQQILPKILPPEADGHYVSTILHVD